MKSVSLQPAFVLHRRPYRETSFLVDILTLEHGRLTVVAKGVRKARANLQGLLQPFTPLTISWHGNGDLVTLVDVEMRDGLIRLSGDCLFAGFYLNELLTILLQKWDPHPALFQLYENTLVLLQSGKLEEQYLRMFEKQLVHELGYGFLPKAGSMMQTTIEADHYYRYHPNDGLMQIAIPQTKAESIPTLFAGKHLLHIANDEWTDAETLLTAKRLMRLILTPMLGTRSLHSRFLFVK